MDSLGRYHIEDRIGAGGAGVVYRARDGHLDRDVAIKVLAEGTLADEGARRRFHREALALSKLNHPNIATIHDFVTEEGRDYLVMEHIPGPSVADLVARGALPEKDVLKLGAQLADGLAAAHEQGLIHRDLKPANLRVTPEGRLKILDFGLARRLTLDPSVTTQTSDSPFAGTLPYMSPEQVSGGMLDARSDIYSAGAVLYELATGRRPFAELSGAALAGHIVDAAPEPPSSVNRRITPRLENIILKALEKDPALRYQSARELAIDLERAAVPASRPKETAPIWARPLTWAIVAAIVLSIGIPAAYYYWVRSHQLQPHGLVLVTDFENSTGDAALAQAVREGLTIQLQQSRYLNVLSREQVSDAMRRMRRNDAPLDTRTGLELCQRESIPAMISGSLYRAGDTVWLAARVMDTNDDRVLFSTASQLRLDNGFQDRIDAVATRIRNSLGESSAGIQESSRPLARVTTTSIEALKQYSMAAEAMRSGRTADVRQRLETALSVDPKFAMAHLLLARLYETLGDAEHEREHLARAYDLRDSLTERERIRVEAQHFKGIGQYKNAVERLTVLTNLYPSDSEAHYELAIAYGDAGDDKRSIDELEKTLSLSPVLTAAYGDLMTKLAASGSFARAREVYRAAQQRNITGEKLTLGIGMVLFGEDRPEDARREFASLESMGGAYANAARLYQSATLIYEGKLRDADAELERDVLSDQKEHQELAQLKRLQWLAKSALLRGDAPRTRLLIERMLQLPSALGTPNTLRVLGTLFARTGNVARAREMLMRLDEARAKAPDAYTESCYQSVLGEIALQERRTGTAVEALRAAAAQYPIPDSVERLAHAYTATADLPRAVEQWQAVVNSRGPFLQRGFPADWVVGHLYLARALLQSGDAARARAEYDLFLKIWSGADPSPLLTRAVQERRGLH